MRNIFKDLLLVYGLYSKGISDIVKSRSNESMLKPMKALRRDILKLIQCYIEVATDYQIFIEEFLPTLKTLVDDYQ